MNGTNETESKRKGLMPDTLSRKEYWIRILIIWGAGWIIAGVEMAIFGQNTGMGPLSTAIWVCTIVFQISRLKDAGRSKLWLFADLLLIVGVIIIGCLPTAEHRKQI